MKLIDMANLEFVDAREVPLARKGVWPQIYDKIPLGKAVVIPVDLKSTQTVWSALHRYHKKGEYMNLEARRFADRTYIINNAEDS